MPLSLPRIPLFAPEALRALKAGALFLYAAAFCFFAMQVENLGTMGDRGWGIWSDASVITFQLLVEWGFVRYIAHLGTMLYWIALFSSGLLLLAFVPIFAVFHPALSELAPTGRTGAWFEAGVACWLLGLACLMSRSVLRLFWSRLRERMSG